MLVVVVVDFGSDVHLVHLLATDFPDQCTNTRAHKQYNNTRQDAYTDTTVLHRCSFPVLLVCVVKCFTILVTTLIRMVGVELLCSLSLLFNYSSRVRLDTTASKHTTCGIRNVSFTFATPEEIVCYGQR